MSIKNITSILGLKIEQSQRFDDKGVRIPVTIIEAGPCYVVAVKQLDKDGYNALQLGFGVKREKNITKPILGHIKKAGIKTNPRFLKEIKVSENVLKPGDIINVSEVFQIGDMVDVVGTSRGRGFTGVVKRHHFKGGPRTHGQSDRERAPGSIGQTTTPGRVYKGKRMAGRSGGERVTVRNLKVFNVDGSTNKLIVRGIIPGTRNSLVIINKI